MSEYLSLPEDLKTLSDEDLITSHAGALERFDTLAANQPVTLEEVQTETAEMEILSASMQTLRTEQTRRTETAAAMTAKREELAANRAVLTAAAAAATATMQVTERAPRKLNPSLADVQQAAPALIVPRKEAVLVASADIPDFQPGSRLNDLSALVLATQNRAHSVPITHKGDDAPRYPIASLLREHRFQLGPDASAAEVNAVLIAATDPEITVAAGGWCSPSEISYDFYNIVCEDGMLNVPTIGINRGGWRFPTSPSFADIASSLALFRWTETQDIAAVTGTAQSGTKTCARVPCPGFNEDRLACDGICLTVGNLTEDAYPEVVSNTIRLLQAAHAHKINRLRIAQLQAFANTPSVTGTFGAAGEGLVAPVMNYLALNANDYRSRFAMCLDAVLEVIAPRWLRSAMRSDLRYRTGAPTDQLSFTDAQLMNLFDTENLRVQWVSDYQERTTGFPGFFVNSGTPILPGWPATVEFLMFAPGTVVLGQGMRLNFGIVRDSILNQTNDHTGLWMEECWLLSKPGHEVRRIVVNICADGTTGAHDLTACH